MKSIISKPERKVYTMRSYMENMRDGYIRTDQDVQRMAGCWNNGMVNELIYTVLTDDYIPTIVLGEDLSLKTYIIDGLQRSTSFKLFRFGNYKITSAIRNSVVQYRKLVDGEIVIDSFDIKGATYETLPVELQKKFDEFQVETVTHEGCTTERLSELVYRYNRNQAMSTGQRAFTNIDKFARKIREVLDNHFFIECGSYTEKERVNGTMERVIMESAMATYHLDDWKKSAEKVAQYLNVNGLEKEFDSINENLSRLDTINNKHFKEMFTSKDTFIWLSLFDKFVKTGFDDRKFSDFVNEFFVSLHSKNINGNTYDTLDELRNTKDKSTVVDKLVLLTKLMLDYLHINIEETQSEEINTLEFICKNVSEDTTEEDVIFYQDMLDDLTLNVDNNSKLLNEGNLPSLLAIIAYSCRNDIDLDDWFIEYFNTNNTYIKDQKANFLHIKQDLNKFLGIEVKIAS